MFKWIGNKMCASRVQHAAAHDHSCMVWYPNSMDFRYKPAQLCKHFLKAAISMVSAPGYLKYMLPLNFLNRKASGTGRTVRQIFKNQPHCATMHMDMSLNNNLESSNQQARQRRKLLSRQEPPFAICRPFEWCMSSLICNVSLDLPLAHAVAYCRQGRHMRDC